MRRIFAQALLRSVGVRSGRESRLIALSFSCRFRSTTTATSGAIEEFGLVEEARGRSGDPVD